MCMNALTDVCNVTMFRLQGPKREDLKGQMAILCTNAHCPGHTYRFQYLICGDLSVLEF